MNIRLIKMVKDYWTQWIKKRSPAKNPQRFNSKNIYILPSGFGLVFGAVLISLFLGAINYQISTIFLMVFLVGAIGLISAWEAHANLKEISLKFISIEDVQQGKPAQMRLFIQGNDKVHYALEFQIGNDGKKRIEQVPLEGLHVIVPIKTATRGFFSVPCIHISSMFPFGIFRVWSYAFFDKGFYVYPEPISPEFWPPSYSSLEHRKEDFLGENEFYELKQIENPWIQPNLIAWKVAAKGQGWYRKIMDNWEGEYYFFSLNDLGYIPVEKKLQHLSYWLQTSESMGIKYGLELGKNRTPLSQGPEHLKYCLRQLALY